jgi:putative ABC transport system permease protein
MLLAGAGLLLRSFWLLQEVKPGFDPDRLVTFRTNLPRSRYDKNEKAVDFFNRLVTQVDSQPGVTSAAITSLIPMDAGNTTSEITVPGVDASPDGSKPSAAWRIVGPGYFNTMGIPLKGRDFDSRDTGDGQPVIIISEELARRSWPAEDPIGKTIIMHSFGNKLRTVIGVAGDVRSFGLDADASPVVYASLGEAALWNPMHLIVRTTTEPSAQVGAVREVFKSLDGAVPVFNIRTLDEIISNSQAQRRFTMLLLVTFAGLALLLACVGLFGVMAYVVSQRTHEIGIRLALGARRLDVFRIVVGRGMLFAGIGSAIGAAGAVALGIFAKSLVADLLFQVTATDPLAFVGAAVLLLGVAFWACYVPALRATRVDPITALRYE